MEIDKLTENVEVIQTLSDYPNTDGGLTSAELKAKFDEGNRIIKEYLNGTVVPALSPVINELADIRVGADGTTYETAGAAVRNQIEKRSALIVTIDADNKANFNAWEIYLRAQDGRGASLFFEEQHLFIPLAYVDSDVAIFREQELDNGTVNEYRVYRDKSVERFTDVLANMDAISRLRESAVLHTEQNLTAGQKVRARENIGAVSQAIFDQEVAEIQDELDQRVVTTDKRNFSDAAKAQARANIEAFGNGDPSLRLCGETQDEDVIVFVNGTAGDRIPVLRFDGAQTEIAPVLRGISDGIEEQDATTIGQLTKNVVYYSKVQNLTGEQKQQARENIGAADIDEMANLRMDYDGKTHETAGQAVRGQFDHVYTKIEKLEMNVGDIETALDSILAIQNELIGGGA